MRAVKSRELNEAFRISQCEPDLSRACVVTGESPRSRKSPLAARSHPATRRRRNIEINPYNFSFDIILRLLQSPVRRLTKHLNMTRRNHVRQAHREKRLPEADRSRDRRLSVGSRHHHSGSAKAKTVSPLSSTLDVRPSAPSATAKLSTRRPSIRPSKRQPRRAAASFAFPAGNYLCYSIHLKSHVTLFLDPGATIVAADAPAAGAGGGYDPPEPNAWDKFQDFGHSHWHNSLIWGEDLENISIGPGARSGAKA